MTETKILKDFVTAKLTQAFYAYVQNINTEYSETNYAPVYWDVADPNAPRLYAVVTNLGATDVRTQAKFLEYSDFEIDVVVCLEERHDNLAFKGTSDDYLELAQQFDTALTVPSTPVTWSYGGIFSGTFEVTCDRISFRSFTTREDGIKQSKAATRYLVRIQRKID